MKQAATAAALTAAAVAPAAAEPVDPIERVVPTAPGPVPSPVPVGSLATVGQYTSTGPTLPPAGVVSPTIGPAPIQFNAPPLETKHYLELYPEAGPQPDPDHPGVWRNADGSPYTPRVRGGGQFSALLLVVKPRFGNRTRDVGLPLLLWDKPHEWPLDAKRQEVVVRRVQVVFDFEDELQAFLAEHGTANGDPLGRNFAKNSGLDPRLYDAESTSAKARFNNAMPG